MDKFKNAAKGGWRPGKDGKSIRGSIKGLVGKEDKGPEYGTYNSPYVRKDPSLFPPPPKTKTYEPGTGPVAAPKPEAPGTPVSKEDEPIYRTGPFQANTLGVDNSQYPKPPPRFNGQSPPPAESAKTPRQNAPSLPPRLPPRNAMVEGGPQSQATRPGDGYLNQSALNRLGQAGISVPGFGIGAASPPQVPSRTEAPPIIPKRNSGSVQVNELQSRFSQLGTTSANAPATGTSWAEKQAALKTANDLKNNPASVSLKDMRSAATTAKNFHDRHGEQVATGVQSANQLNQRYGLLDRAKGLQQAASGSSGGISGIEKRPPPTPPAKKPELQGLAPPVPLGSKPRG